MILSIPLAALLLTASTVTAQEPPALPDKPIAEKRELLFSEDFEGAEPAKVWHKVVPTFVIASKEVAQHLIDTSGGYWTGPEGFQDNFRSMWGV